MLLSSSFGTLLVGPVALFNFLTSFFFQFNSEVSMSSTGKKDFVVCHTSLHVLTERSFETIKLYRIQAS